MGEWVRVGWFLTSGWGGNASRMGVGWLPHKWVGVGVQVGWELSGSLTGRVGVGWVSHRWDGS